MQNPRVVANFRARQFLAKRQIKKSITRKTGARKGRESGFIGKEAQAMHFAMREIRGGFVIAQEMVIDGILSRARKNIGKKAYRLLSDARVAGSCGKAA